MYSDMSMRTIACSSLNRNAASARLSSVLPTPVGPRNMNEPIGRFGSCKPARDRRTAWATARTASSWPTTRLASTSSIRSSLSRSPSSIFSTGTPVQRETTPAIWSGVTASSIIRRGLAVAGFRFAQLLLQLGDDAVGQFAGAGQIALALRLLQFDAATRPALP